VLVPHAGKPRDQPIVGWLGARVVHWRVVLVALAGKSWGQPFVGWLGVSWFSGS
jgi:hypothetical protein